MQLLTIGRAAKLLGMTTETLRNWTKQGRLTPAMTTLGGHRRYDPLDIMKLAEAMSNNTPKVKQEEAQ